MTQPNYISSRPRLGFLIQPGAPWHPFWCVPLSENGGEPLYSYPGERRYTAAELFRICQREGWPIHEKVMT